MVDTVRGHFLTVLFFVTKGRFGILFLVSLFCLSEFPAGSRSRMQKFCSRSFFEIHSRLYLALLEESSAEQVAKGEFIHNYIVVSPSVDLVSIGSLRTFNPTLAEVHSFDCMVTNIIRAQSTRCNLVFSTGKEVRVQIRLAFLLASNMILSHGYGYEEAFAALKPMHSLLNRLNLTAQIIDYFRALKEAKLHKWIDFKDRLKVEEDSLSRIEMEEYVHCSLRKVIYTIPVVHRRRLCP